MKKYFAVIIIAVAFAVPVFVSAQTTTVNLQNLQAQIAALQQIVIQLQAQLNALLLSINSGSNSSGGSGSGSGGSDNSGSWSGSGNSSTTPPVSNPSSSVDLEFPVSYYYASCPAIMKESPGCKVTFSSTVLQNVKGGHNGVRFDVKATVKNTSSSQSAGSFKVKVYMAGKSGVLGLPRISELFALRMGQINSTSAKTVKSIFSSITDKELLGEISFSGLAAGATATNSVNVVFNGYGVHATYPIFLVIDEEQQVSESDDDDNVSFFTVTVG